MKEDIIIDISHIKGLIEYRETEAKSACDSGTELDLYDLQTDCNNIQEILEKVLQYIKKDE